MEFAQTPFGSPPNLLLFLMKTTRPQPLAIAMKVKTAHDRRA